MMPAGVGGASSATRGSAAGNKINNASSKGFKNVFFIIIIIISDFQPKTVRMNVKSLLPVQGTADMGFCPALSRS